MAASRELFPVRACSYGSRIPVSIFAAAAMLCACGIGSRFFVLLCLAADPAAADGAVGRITGDEIKRSSCENAVCFSDISLYNGYPVLKSVESNAPFCKVCACGLDLQSGQVRAVRPVGQKNGNNTVSCAQVKTSPGLFHLHIGSKQNGVHSKAESGGIMDDPQPALLQAAPVFPLEIIDPLSRAE